MDTNKFIFMTGATSGLGKISALKAARKGSGEYYADKKITATTKQSYDTEVGKKLLQTIRTYLNPYIDSESPIFNSDPGLAQTHTL